VTDREKHRNRSLWRAGCLALVLVLVVGLATLALTYRCWLTALASALALDKPPVYAEAIVAGGQRKPLPPSTGDGPVSSRLRWTVDF